MIILREISSPFEQVIQYVFFYIAFERKVAENKQKNQNF